MVGGCRTARLWRHRERRETPRAPHHSSVLHTGPNDLGQAGRDSLAPLAPQCSSTLMRRAQSCGLYSVSPAVLGVSPDQLYEPTPTHSRERLQGCAPDAVDETYHRLSPNLTPESRRL